MTITPESPALPGDLTDETIERVHQPEPFPVYIDPECGACNCEHEGECPTRDVQVCTECLRIAEAASPGWVETRFDLGLVAWPCAAARVAPEGGDAE